VESAEDALALRDFGDKEHLFGIHPVLLALKAGKREIFRVYCKKDLEITNRLVGEIHRLATERGIEFISVEGKVFKRVFDKGTVHQGVFCFSGLLPVDVFDIEELLGASEENCTSDSFNPISKLPDLNTTFRDVVIKKTSTNQSEEHSSPRTSNILNEGHTKVTNEEEFIKINCQNAEVKVEDGVNWDLESKHTWEYDRYSNDTLPTVLKDEKSEITTEKCSTTDLKCVETQNAPEEITATISKIEDRETASEENPATISEAEILENASKDYVVPISKAEKIENACDDHCNTSLQRPRPVAQKRLWVMLDQVVDPMNVGAVLRSCCYFGVSRVLVTPSS
jgi:tRNA G18 (ribose-2'-O)-methylase SpoU